jgi:hypothetical protein
MTYPPPPLRDQARPTTSITPFLPAPRRQVGNEGQRLKWPESTPAEYRDLAEACTSPDPSARPAFADIVDAVQRMQELLAQGRLAVDGGFQGEWV